MTKLTPVPEIAACPLQTDEPVQPSLIKYVCCGVPAGTVYCTCAHTLPPVMHAIGGWLPEPVSSYTTSTPTDEYTRNTVCPVQLAPGYIALHIDTVNVWPALAITPQTGSFDVSVLVWLPENRPQNETDVGAIVGTELGAGVGAVGLAVGIADGSPGGMLGLAVGNELGFGEGRAVVGTSVGTELGAAVLPAVGAGVGE